MGQEQSKPKGGKHGRKPSVSQVVREITHAKRPSFSRHRTKRSNSSMDKSMDLEIHFNMQNTPFSLQQETCSNKENYQPPVNISLTKPVSLQQKLDVNKPEKSHHQRQLSTGAIDSSLKQVTKVELKSSCTRTLEAPKCSKNHPTARNAPFFVQQQIYSRNQNSQSSNSVAESPKNAPFYRQRELYSLQRSVPDHLQLKPRDSKSSPYYIQQKIYANISSSSSEIASEQWKQQNSPFFIQQRQYANNSFKSDSISMALKMRQNKSTPFHRQCQLYSTIQAQRKPTTRVHEDKEKHTLPVKTSPSSQIKVRSAPFFMQQQIYSKDHKTQSSISLVQSVQSSPFYRQRELYSTQKSVSKSSVQTQVKPRDYKSSPYYIQQKLYANSTPPTANANLAAKQQKNENSPFFVQQRLYAKNSMTPESTVTLKPRETRSAPFYCQRQLYSGTGYLHQEPNAGVKTFTDMRTPALGTPANPTTRLQQRNAPFFLQQQIYSKNQTSQSTLSLIESVQKSPLYRQRELYSSHGNAPENSLRTPVRLRDSKNSPYYMQQKQYAKCSSSTAAISIAANQQKNHNSPFFIQQKLYANKSTMSASTSFSLKPRETKSTPFYSQQQIYCGAKGSQQMSDTKVKVKPIREKSNQNIEKHARSQTSLQKRNAPFFLQQRIYSKNHTPHSSTSLRESVQNSPFYCQREIYSLQGRAVESSVQIQLRPRDSKSSPYYIQQKLYASNSPTAANSLLGASQRQHSNSPFFIQQSLYANNSRMASSTPMAREIKSTPFYRQQQLYSGAVQPPQKPTKANPKPTSQPAFAPIPSLSKTQRNTPFDIQRRVYCKDRGCSDVCVLKPREAKSAPFYLQQNLYAGSEISSPGDSIAERREITSTPFSFLVLRTDFASQHAARMEAKASPTPKLCPSHTCYGKWNTPFHRQQTLYSKCGSMGSVSSSMAQRATPFDLQRQRYCSKSSGTPSATLKPREIQNAPLYRQRQLYTVQHSERVSTAQAVEGVHEQTSAVDTNLKLRDSTMKQTSAVDTDLKLRDSMTKTVKETGPTRAPSSKHINSGKWNTPLGYQRTLYAKDESKGFVSSSKAQRSTPFDVHQRRYCGENSGSPSGSLKPRETQNAPLYRQREICSIGTNSQNTNGIGYSALSRLMGRENQNSPLHRQRSIYTNQKLESHTHERAPSDIICDLLHSDEASSSAVLKPWLNPTRQAESSKMLTTFTRPQKKENPLGSWLKDCFGWE